MKLVKKLIAALTATTLIAVSGLSSVCMAAREFDYLAEYYRQSECNCEYSLEMLKSVDKSVGLKSSEKDGNYFKKDNLSDEEKKIYDAIVAKVDEIKKSIGEDDSNLPEDYKLAKVIFFWVRNNIEYDEESISTSAEENTVEDKYGVLMNSKNRKPQDALTVFKSQKGLCEGVANLVQLMMKIAGLSCICVGNHVHEFNAVWLGENPGDWALFDATVTASEKQYEQKNFNENEEIRLKYNNSLDNMILDEKFPAAYRYKSSASEESNKCFINKPFLDNYIYVVSDDLADFYKCGTNQNGVSYMLSPKTLIVSANNDSIFVDKKMLQYKSRCMISGNIKNIENFDVFYRNFVRVDVSRSNIEQTLKKDGIEFNLSCDGNQSKLTIKSLEDGKNFDAVTIPNELIPFLPDIDEFKVDSNIKTVKYDFLWKEHAFKKNVILPKDVKFEQTDLIS